MELIKFHIRKNDMVQVIAGKEKGKTGKVLRVLSKKNRVVVEKINFIKRHSRPSAKSRQGDRPEGSSDSCLQCSANMPEVQPGCAHRETSIREWEKDPGL